MATAVLADALRKRYPGSTAPALDGFDLAVPAGTVHGLLGPNGAGKTTAVRILATLLRADSGRAEIDGIVVRHAADIERAAAVVGRVTGVTPEVDRDARRVGAPVRDRMAALGAIVPALVEARVDAEDVVVRRPMLDEVFLQLTVLMAVLWPLVIVAVFAPLSIRRYRDLSR